MKTPAQTTEKVSRTQGTQKDGPCDIRRDGHRDTNKEAVKRFIGEDPWLSVEALCADIGAVTEKKIFCKNYSKYKI